MKKLLSFALCLLFTVAQMSAADPFRSHRYDVFKVLPLNEQNIVFVGNSITNMHEWWEAFGSEGRIVNRGVWGTFIGETVQHIEAVAMGTRCQVSPFLSLICPLCTQMGPLKMPAGYHCGCQMRRLGHMGRSPGREDL